MDTGYTAQQIDDLMDSEISYGDFFRQAPAMNPNREKITGVVCGVRKEKIAPIFWVKRFIVRTKKQYSMFDRQILTASDILS